MEKTKWFEMGHRSFRIEEENKMRVDVCRLTTVIYLCLSLIMFIVFYIVFWVSNINVKASNVNDIMRGFP